MELFRFLVIVIVSVVSLQYVHCVFGSINLPFISFGGGFNTQNNQDRTVSETISKLIADARSTSINVRYQANDIAQEILETNHRFSDEFGANVTESINEIFRPSEQLIQRTLFLNVSNSNCSRALSNSTASAINETISQFIECKLNKIEQGLAIVERLHSNCENATNIARNAVEGLGNCTRLANGTIFGLISPTVLACKFRLAVNTGQEFANLGINITRSINEAGIYLKSLKIDLVICKVNATINAAESITQIITNATLCYTNSTGTD